MVGGADRSWTISWTIQGNRGAAKGGGCQVAPEGSPPHGPSRHRRLGFESLPLRHKILKHIRICGCTTCAPYCAPARARGASRSSGGCGSRAGRSERRRNTSPTPPTSASRSTAAPAPRRRRWLPRAVQSRRGPHRPRRRPHNLSTPIRTYPA